MDTAWHKKSLPRLAGRDGGRPGGGKEPAKPPLGGFSPHDGETKKGKRRDVACNVSKARVAAVKPSNDAAWQLYPPFRPSGTFPRKRGKGKVPDWRTQYLHRLAGVGRALAHRGVACFCAQGKRDRQTGSQRSFLVFETLPATSLQNPAITPLGNGDNPQRLRTCHSTRRMPRAAVRVRPATMPTHNPATPMLSQ